MAYFETFIFQKSIGLVFLYRGVSNDSEQELETAGKFGKVKNSQSLSVTWAYHALCLFLLARDNPKSKIVNLKSAIECAQHALQLADEDAKTDAPTPRDYVPLTGFLVQPIAPIMI
jgi:hypothetical protein